MLNSKKGKIFADIYGAGDVINPTVDNDSIIIGVADYTQDMKSLIAYAVGCMFGRYSLGRDGLVYAGGTWDSSLYPIFAADADNIIPICDDDYFEDDIVHRFEKIVSVAFEEENLNRLFPMHRRLDEINIVEFFDVLIIHLLDNGFIQLPLLIFKLYLPFIELSPAVC